jgi:hypothetical protein
MTQLVSYKNISMSDLIRCPGFDGTDDKIKELLYKLGADISKPIETMVCEHRNLSNQVVTCEYFICIERLDKAWIQSGHASIEALYASKPDIAQDLIKMSRQGIGERVFKKNANGETNHNWEE